MNMWRTMRLAKLPRLPHEVWQAYGMEFTPEEALDFDYAVIDFIDWYDGMANEQKIGPDKSLKPKKGQTIVPKYGTVGEILDRYGGSPRASHHVAAPEELLAVASTREELDSELDSVMDLFTDSLGDDFL